MPAQEFLLHEQVFLNRSLYEEAERLYSLRKDALYTAVEGGKAAVSAKCAGKGGESVKVGDLVDRLHTVEEENKRLRALVATLEARLGKLEVGGSGASTTTTTTATPAAAPANDDDFDLFGDEEEDSEEKKRITEQRLAAYNAKKSGKQGVIAKSSILLDIKVWDDETDMAALEKCVRGVQMDGLVWGQSKLVPVAYGVKKLQIGCVIEDDKVSTEVLEETICEFEDYVQSVDIAAFNKI